MTSPPAMSTGANYEHAAWWCGYFCQPAPRPHVRPELRHRPGYRRPPTNGGDAERRRRHRCDGVLVTAGAPDEPPRTPTGIETPGRDAPALTDGSDAAPDVPTGVGTDVGTDVGVGTEVGVGTGGGEVGGGAGVVAGAEELDDDVDARGAVVAPVVVPAGPVGSGWTAPGREGAPPVVAPGDTAAAPGAPAPDVGSGPAVLGPVPVPPAAPGPGTDPCVPDLDAGGGDGSEVLAFGRPGNGSRSPGRTGPPSRLTASSTT